MRHRRIASIELALLLGWAIPASGSDHADPLVLNPLRPPTIREPRITDLHVFLDSDQNPGSEPKALILSMCVFPAMAPLDVVRQVADMASNERIVRARGMAEPGDSASYKLPALDLDGYEYDIFMDLHSRLAFASAADLDRYGGTIVTPTDISAEVQLTFVLNDDATLKDFRSRGLDRSKVVVNAPFVEGAINVRTGVFDDPFIFPRFFRTNVVAMVVSIPLGRFDAQQRDFLVWAATRKDGVQIDHVGRSQRTQLPRFDGLNTLPPREHVAEIVRRHSEPTLGEDVMRTFLSPLFGTRPFDFAPDVLIYSRSKPTLFPNGRKLPDDVAWLIGRTGDTQLLEAAYTDDPRYPRAVENDKPFTREFPYLAPPWTKDEVAAMPRGFSLGRASFTNANWRMLWLIEMVVITALGIGLFVSMRSDRLRIVFALLVVIVSWQLLDIRAANLPATDTSKSAMMQQSLKLSRTVLGAAFGAGMFLAWLFVLGRRSGEKLGCADASVRRGGDALTLEDRQYVGSTFERTRDEVMREPYYRVWRGPDEKPLPVYDVTFDSVAKGLLRPRKSSVFVQAQARTLVSRADMRWGVDGKGFRRLLHPNGVCLAGDWIIDPAPAGRRYTGCFAPGTRAKILARYSTCCSATRGGAPRSLSMVGKVYVARAPSPANFFTQEDLGGTVTESFREAVLTNSPPITPWRRGAGIFTFILTGLTFSRSDKGKEERQLYELAELGKSESEPTSCPRFMRLTCVGEPPLVREFGADFRDEILGAIYDPGNPAPKRVLTFKIEVSDDGDREGLLVQRIVGQRWTEIGRIEFREAAVSYNGDFVIHFHHPVWRNDRNDPRSVARPR